MEQYIPDTEILFSHVYTPGVMYTHSPYFGFRGFGGGAPENFFWDVCWPTVLWTHGIGLTLELSHCISPIKENIVDGIVLYWKRDCESVKKKCNSFAAGCIPSSFWTVIKGLEISLWTEPIIWVNHIISVSLCNVLMCFASCLLI